MGKPWLAFEAGVISRLSLLLRLPEKWDYENARPSYNDSLPDLWVVASLDVAFPIHAQGACVLEMHQMILSIQTDAFRMNEL